MSEQPISLPTFVQPPPLVAIAIIPITFTCFEYADVTGSSSLPYGSANLK